MRTNTVTNTPRYRISNETSELLECITEVNGAYDHVLTRLSNVYGDEELTAAMAKQFTTAQVDAIKALEELLHERLQETLLEQDNTAKHTVLI